MLIKQFWLSIDFCFMNNRQKVFYDPQKKVSGLESEGKYTLYFKVQFSLLTHH